MGATINVLVVDDHLLVRRGIAQLLEGAQDIVIVGEADSGDAALAQCAALEPDIVLMDLRMPGMDGLAATDAIRRKFPHVRIIGLSTFAEDHTVGGMIARGASMHLPKSVSFEELTGAIRKVAAGETAIPAAAAVPLAAAPRPAGAITGQQRRVLALLAKGFTNSEIARYLGISVSTANYHVGAILAKLGVSNRTEAAAIAVREQLVDGYDL